MKEAAEPKIKMKMNQGPRKMEMKMKKGPGNERWHYPDPSVHSGGDLCVSEPSRVQ